MKSLINTQLDFLHSMIDETFKILTGTGIITEAWYRIERKKGEKRASLIFEFETEKKRYGFKLSMMSNVHGRKFRTKRLLETALLFFTSYGIKKTIDTINTTENMVQWKNSYYGVQYLLTAKEI